MAVAVRTYQIMYGFDEYYGYVINFFPFYFSCKTIIWLLFELKALIDDFGGSIFLLIF